MVFEKNNLGQLTIPSGWKIVPFVSVIEIWNERDELVMCRPKPYEPMKLNVLIDIWLNEYIVDNMKNNCKNWMIQNADEFVKDGELNITELVQVCADKFTVPNCLDDETHWIWEMALSVEKLLF